MDAADVVDWSKLSHFSPDGGCRKMSPAKSRVPKKVIPLAEVSTISTISSPMWDRMTRGRLLAEQLVQCHRRRICLNRFVVAGALARPPDRSEIIERRRRRFVRLGQI